MEPSTRHRALSLAFVIVVQMAYPAVFPRESALRQMDAKRTEMDARRISDLTAISHEVNGYFGHHSRLPTSLDEASIHRRDPRTDEPYRYEVKDPRSYELCASFERSTRSPQFAAGHFWMHPSGMQCVTVSADKR